jgi:dual specificity protein kinase CLK2/3
VRSGLCSSIAASHRLYSLDENNPHGSQDRYATSQTTFHFSKGLICIVAENILLVSDKVVDFEGQRVPASTRLKLIDFGGSCYDHEKKSSVINTRQYRAPEVMLGTGWSMPSDIWSLGCILVELYEGELLFGTHDSVEHLALIERIIGLFPYWMIHEAKRGKQHVLADEAFDSAGYHRLDRVLSPDSFEYVRTSRPLNRLSRRNGWFFELVLRMLVIDPDKRARADDCLHFLRLHGRDHVRVH